MASSKLVLFSIFLALILIQITADPDANDEFLKIELDELKSKVFLLESNIKEKIRELKTKDESIKKMEDIIQEKSDSIVSLQNNIQALHERESLDAKKQVGEAHARIRELESQVSNLREETEKLYQKRDALESRVDVAEKKVSELNSKLEGLKRISDEQKTRIRKTERALRVAEEDVMKAKLQASTISKELKEVRDSWVPQWLSVHLLHCQSLILTQWNERGRPTLDALFQKALKKRAQVLKWAEPHIETVKNNWIPVMKKQSSRFVTQIGPKVKLLSTKTSEIYYASRKSIEPHVVKLKESMDARFQEVKKFTKPYTDHVVTVAKPHVANARVFLKPYTKRISRTYRKFSRAFTLYHLQLQTTIREKLKNYELTEPLATKEIVWFLASTSFALPVIFLFKLVSPLFCKKPKRRNRNSHTSHARRKAKRVHPDK